MEVANYCIKKQPVSEIRLRGLITSAHASGQRWFLKGVEKELIGS